MSGHGGLGRGGVHEVDDDYISPDDDEEEEEQEKREQRALQEYYATEEAVSVSPLPHTIITTLVVLPML